MNESTNVIWLAVTAVATSMVALSVLARGISWCLQKWKQRVSWNNLRSEEKDIVWGIGVSGTSTFMVDYESRYTGEQKPLAFVYDNGQAASNESKSLTETTLYVFITYVIEVESLQDKDLVRPYSQVLLKLTPTTYTARPRLHKFIQANRSLIGKHEVEVLGKINFGS